jgi:hypothetical protein
MYMLARYLFRVVVIDNGCHDDHHVAHYSICNIFQHVRVLI